MGSIALSDDGTPVYVRHDGATYMVVGITYQDGEPDTLRLVPANSADPHVNAPGAITVKASKVTVTRRPNGSPGSAPAEEGG